VNTLDVVDMTGAAVGKVNLEESTWVGTQGEEALREVILAYQASRRAGSASTLSKGEVSGSGRKPWKQKGTGRARAGYRQSPVWRGGSVAFGPRPRSYAVKTNKKIKRLAFRRALADRISAGDVTVIDELKVPEIKTKTIVTLLKTLNLDRGALIVMGTVDFDVALSARNIPGIDVVTAESLNAYHLVRYPAIVITREALAAVESRLKGSGSEAS
jgi:large subunit ribosomal protein L4